MQNIELEDFRAEVESYRDWVLEDEEDPETLRPFINLFERKKGESYVIIGFDMYHRLRGEFTARLEQAEGHYSTWCWHITTENILAGEIGNPESFVIEKGSQMTADNEQLKSELLDFAYLRKAESRDWERRRKNRRKRRIKARRRNPKKG